MDRDPIIIEALHLDEAANGKIHGFAQLTPGLAVYMWKTNAQYSTGAATFRAVSYPDLAVGPPLAVSEFTVAYTHNDANALTRVSGNQFAHHGARAGSGQSLSNPDSALTVFKVNADLSIEPQSQTGHTALGWRGVDYPYYESRWDCAWGDIADGVIMISYNKSGYSSGEGWFRVFDINANGAVSPRAQNLSFEAASYSARIHGLGDNRFYYANWESHGNSNGWTYIGVVDGDTVTLGEPTGVDDYPPAPPTCDLRAGVQYLADRHNRAYVVRNPDGAEFWTLAYAQLPCPTGWYWRKVVANFSDLSYYVTGGDGVGQEQGVHSPPQEGEVFISLPVFAGGGWASAYLQIGGPALRNLTTGELWRPTSGPLWERWASGQTCNMWVEGDRAIVVMGGLTYNTAFYLDLSGAYFPNLSGVAGPNSRFFR